MTYAETMTAMKAKRAEITALRGEIRTLQAKAPRQEVQDYVLAGWRLFRRSATTSRWT